MRTPLQERLAAARLAGVLFLIGLAGIEIAMV